MKSSSNTAKALLGGLFGLLLTFAFVGTASADLTVTFNPFPTTAITTGLTPDSLVLGGYFAGSYTVPAENSPIDLGLGTYLFDAGWSEGTYPSNHNPWGATNPFVNSSLDGSEYDAIYNGYATYNYGAPQSALTILWGTIGPNDAIEFLDQDGNPLTKGTIDGSDLLAADTGYAQPDSVDITIQVPQDFYSVETIGGSLSFEYSNLVATPAVVVPEPSTYALLLGGLGLLAFFRFRTRRSAS